MIATASLGAATDLGVAFVAQILAAQKPLEMWFVRGEFSRTVGGVCAAGLDSRSSFGDVIFWVAFGIGAMLVFLVTMSNFAHAKLST